MADEGEVALFTELSIKVIQVHRPDQSTSKVVSFYVTDLKKMKDDEKENISTAEVLLAKKNWICP